MTRVATTETGAPNVVALAAMRSKPIHRNTAGLREMLFDELEAFLMGRTAPERGRVAAKLADSILNSARLDLEYARYCKTRGASKRSPVAAVKLAKRVA